MSYIIPEIDRAAELATLRDELKHAYKRRKLLDNEGKRFIDRQITQINRDILRNQIHYYICK